MSDTKELLKTVEELTAIMQIMSNRLFAYEAFFGGFITYYFSKTDAGRADFDEFAELLRLGAKDFLEKGFASKEDAEQIENLLTRLAAKIVLDPPLDLEKIPDQTDFVN